MRDGHVLLSSRDAKSVVWRLGNTVIKEAPKCQIDTEFYFLTNLSGSGYVPAPVQRTGVEQIKMPFIQNSPVTDPVAFMRHYELVLDALHQAGCRHGDLTEYAVLVNRNKPVIIDFAEARFFTSPLPSKRPEGDSWWLEKTMKRLAGYNVG